MYEYYLFTIQVMDAKNTSALEMEVRYTRFPDYGVSPWSVESLERFPRDMHHMTFHQLYRQIEKDYSNIVIKHSFK
jgi:hypothetical protein